MKKIMAMLLMMTVCFGLAACGSNTPGASNTTTTPTTVTPADTTAPADLIVEPETEPKQEVNYLSLGGAIENDKFRMTFESMEILDEYSYKTSEYSSTSLYVENGYKLLLVRGHMENTSTSAISDSCFVRTVTVNGEYVVSDFDVRLNFIRDKYFEIDPYTELEYCLYINIPEKLAEKFETAEFTLAFNNDMSLPVTTWNADGTKSTPMDNTFALVSSLGVADANSAENQETIADEPTSAEPTSRVINIGDVISTEDFEFTLNNVELTYELKPRNTSSVYTSYEAPDGKVYIHVDGYLTTTRPKRTFALETSLPRQQIMITAIPMMALLLLIRMIIALRGQAVMLLALLWRLATIMA